jgi:outer membrane protein OmpA-like peptidoglycan-associated protein
VPIASFAPNEVEPLTFPSDAELSMPLAFTRARRPGEGGVEIRGHSDAIEAGKQPGLSLRRARRVVAALIARGVPPAAVCAAGYENSRPRGDDATEEGRAANRRVEIHPIP